MDNYCFVYKLKMTNYLKLNKKGYAKILTNNISF